MAEPAPRSPRRAATAALRHLLALVFVALAACLLVLVAGFVAAQFF